MAAKTNDQAAAYLGKALVRDTQLDGKMEPLTATAQALAGDVRQRGSLLKLMQVVAMNAALPDCLARPEVQRIDAVLVENGATGLPNGIQAHRLTAAAAIASAGGVRGCPVWDSARLEGLPPLDSVLNEQLPSFERMEKKPGGWASVANPLAAPKDDWKAEPAKVALYLEAVAKGVGELNKEAGKVADLVSTLGAHVQALGQRFWHVESLWWAQALYSRSKEKPYRQLQEDERILWMAEDLAEAGPSHQHPGFESFFVETLCRAQFAPTNFENRPVRDWARVLLEAPSAPEVSDQLKEIVDSDATALPVSWLLLSRGKNVAVVLEELPKRAQTLPLELTFAAWATQLLRERQLVRWLNADL
ncbi:MAG TPA: GTPase-associated system all-helical protein GASH [Candidatus Paceibacterota bacterium]|nr:GTPase-associated system all-helical protein GASH [Candidatus Paceibacterota bacterium]